MSFIDDVKRRLSNATPGPWRYGKWIDTPGTDWQVFCDKIEVTPCRSVCLEEDANFIAHAPSDIAKLLELVQIYEDMLKRIECASNYANKCVCHEGATHALTAGAKIKGDET